MPRPPTAPTAEPRFARLAAAIGDPTRARTLARLLDGRCYTAKELAQHAGVTAATMSGHLKLLIDERLVKVRAQGRHRYISLSDGSVAHALEALMRVAEADTATREDRRWDRPAMRPLRCARSCYGHLAGELGVQLHDALLARGWARAASADGEFALTADGVAGLAALGIKLEKATSGRQLYPCLDWSERRDHFAGDAAVQMLEQFLARKWLARSPSSRALALTPRGRQILLGQLLQA